MKIIGAVLVLASVAVVESLSTAGGGSECSREDGKFGLTETKTVPCNAAECPEHGGWGPWSVSEACTVSCGGGDEVQTRLCNGDPSQGGGSECPREDGTFGLIETKTVVCNTAECPEQGGWGPWSVTEACSVSCGGGDEVQTRLCNKDPSQGGGSECPREDGTFGQIETKTVPCNTAECPELGGWGPWPVSEACSVSCGGGDEVQTRLCNKDSPQGGHSADYDGVSGQIQFLDYGTSKTLAITLHEDALVSIAAQNMSRTNNDILVQAARLVLLGTNMKEWGCSSRY